MTESNREEPMYYFYERKIYFLTVSNPKASVYHSHSQQNPDEQAAMDEARGYVVYSPDHWSDTKIGLNTPRHANENQLLCSYLTQRSRSTEAMENS